MLRFRQRNIRFGAAGLAGSILGIAVSVIVAVFAGATLPLAAAVLPHCSKGWKITGYYTPVESDFNTSHLKSIRINGAGQWQFPREFLNAVKSQGWGKTRLGWYLGRVRNQWARASHSLNASGAEAHVGTVATDPAVVPPGTRLTIISLPPPLNHLTFNADDVGGAVTGKHVDVYVGEGEDAHALSYQLGGKDRKVCQQQDETTADAEDTDSELADFGAANTQAAADSTTP
jgi:3D (Asp-Asp-Asp) domain-containing protein